jgi:hypothetical protein
MAAVTLTVLRWNSTALVKFSYMLEHLRIPGYLQAIVSDNALGADDQQERPAQAGIPRGHTLNFEQSKKIWSDLHGDV